MDRTTFVIQMRMGEWEDVSKLQSRVLPLVYAIGPDIEVDEVDLKPDDGIVTVYLRYKGHCGLVSLYSSISRRELCAWAEIKIALVPNEIPDAFTKAAERCESDLDIRMVMRGSAVALGTGISNLSCGDELRNTLESVLAQCNQMEPLLREGEPAPFADNAPCERREATAEARVIN